MFGVAQPGGIRAGRKTGGNGRRRDYDRTGQAAPPNLIYTYDVFGRGSPLRGGPPNLIYTYDVPHPFILANAVRIANSGSFKFSPKSGI